MENFRVLLVFLFLIPLGCSTSGRKQIIRPSQLKEAPNRSQNYLKSLRRHARTVYHYEDYTLKLAALAVPMTKEMTENLKSEIKRAFSGPLPPAVETIPDEIYPRFNCNLPVLIKAWDETRRVDPLKDKPISWKFIRNGQTPISSKPLNDTADFMDQFFPFKDKWGQWNIYCFSGSASVGDNGFKIESPTALLEFKF